MKKGVRREEKGGKKPQNWLSPSFLASCLPAPCTASCPPPHLPRQNAGIAHRRIHKRKQARIVGLTVLVLRRHRPHKLVVEAGRSAQVALAVVAPIDPRVVLHRRPPVGHDRGWLVRELGGHRPFRPQHVHVSRVGRGVQGGRLQGVAAGRGEEGGAAAVVRAVQARVGGGRRGFVRRREYTRRAGRREGGVGNGHVAHRVGRPLAEDGVADIRAPGRPRAAIAEIEAAAAAFG